MFGLDLNLTSARPEDFGQQHVGRKGTRVGAPEVRSGLFCHPHFVSVFGAQGSFPGAWESRNAAAKTCWKGAKQLNP